MLRIQNTVDKSTGCIPTIPVVLPANAQFTGPIEPGGQGAPNATPVPILPSIHSDRFEYAGRYIQNNSAANNVYYAYGHSCDTTNYNGIIGPLQQFDASNCADAVFCYATAQTTVSTTIIIRRDNFRHTSINDPK